MVKPFGRSKFEVIFVIDMRMEGIKSQYWSGGWCLYRKVSIFSSAAKSVSKSFLMSSSYCCCKIYVNEAMDKLQLELR